MNIELLPPHIEPEHKELIEKGEAVLNEYSEWLAVKLKKHNRLIDCGNIKPKVEDIANASRQFKEDPVRKQMIEHISFLKLCYEKPRFVIRDN